MKRVIIAFFAFAIAFVKTGHTQTVDCDYVFTDLERAICTNPELDVLDKELERLLTQAVSENLLSARAGREIRNQLALRCGASENVAECLIAREQEAIVQLSLVTGKIVEIAASDRSGAISVSKYNVLKSRLAQAGKTYRESGSPEHLVAATLSLLSVYRGDGVRHLPVELHKYEVQALESRVAAGCQNLREHRYWQRALRANGQSCADGLRIADRG